MTSVEVFYEGPVISCAEAKSAGSKFYFTGKPCIKGHVAQRYLKGGCIVCKAAQGEKWRRENPERYKQVQAEWYLENKEYHAEYGRKWRRANPDRVRLLSLRWRSRNRDRYLAMRRARQQSEASKEANRRYDRKRYHLKRKFDPSYRVHQKMRGIISRQLKKGGIEKGGRSWEKLVGYTKDALIKRLKKTIPPGYTWQDYLDGKLHIDHIVPCAAFNVTSAEDIDFRRCWHLSNLQLLPVSVNCAKGAALEKPFQPSFVGI